MPLSERRGRFTVTLSSSVAGGGSPHLLPNAAAAGTPSATAGRPLSSSPCSSPAPVQQRAVKRGRFMVSCLSCGTGLAPTLSGEEQLVAGGGSSSSAGHRVAAPHAAVASAAAAPSPTSSPSRNQQQQQCGMAHERAAAAAAVATAAAPCGPAAALLPRRVRFSEPAGAHEAQPQVPAVPLQQQHKPAQRQPQPEARVAQHMRSYCSGRFAVQESVLVSAALVRCVSVPECCERGSLPLSADILAANQLMSSVAAAEHHHHRHHAAALNAPGGHSSLLASAGSSGACSVSSEDSSASSSSSSGGYCEPLSDESCGLTASCTSSLCSSAAASSSSLAHLRSFSSGDMLAAAAAAQHHHAQHAAPKRSSSVSFFRRGRFLVQTTYT